MAIKLLENAGIETTGLSATAINKLITAGKSGIVGRYLNECALSTTGNTVIISTGKMIIGGVQLEIDTPVSLNLSSVPTEDVRYQVVVELRKGEDEQWVDDIFVRLPSTLIQENFTQGGYTYQFELGRVTHKTTGQVTEVLRTADILYGQSGAGADIEVGEVNTQMISTELPAEVNINKTVDSGKTKLNFNFSLPKPYEDSVTGLVYSSQIVGESVTINNTNDGFVDQIELLGNTIGGDGQPDAPIEIQSVESPVVINVTGKNLFDKNNINLINGYFFLSSTDITAQSDNKIVYVKCPINTTMTVSKLAGSRFSVGYTKEIPDIGVAVYNITQDNAATSLTVTTGSDAKYLCVYYLNNGVLGGHTQQEYIDSIQIEVGATATEYEPYKSQTLTFDLKDKDNNPITIDRLSDTVYDRLYKFENKWWAEKKTEVTTLSPDWGWNYIGAFDNNPNYNYVHTRHLDNLLPSAGAVALSNVLKHLNNALLKHTSLTINESCFSTAAPSDKLRLAIHNSIASNITTFKNWLTTNPVKILYVLATPKHIELSEETGDYLDSIKTFATQTNISSSNVPSPIFDVTELAMGTGEKKYALLTDGDGNAVMPVNEADNTLMFDGRTVEQGLQELRKNIDNFANLATVATSGSYNDLIDKPKTLIYENAIGWHNTGDYAVVFTHSESLLGKTLMIEWALGLSPEGRNYTIGRLETISYMHNFIRLLRRVEIAPPKIWERYVQIKIQEDSPNVCRAAHRLEVFSLPEAGEVVKDEEVFTELTIFRVWTIEL